ncbi:MAG: TetR/AcrR family transcriptional regulator [Acidimicrobiales bacterium]
MRSARLAFESDGFDGTSVSRIVELAAVSRGTFYLYFDSKEGVFRALVDQLQEQILAAQVWPRTMAGPELVRAAIGQFMEFYRDHAQMMAVLEQVAAYSPEFRQLRLDMRRGAAVAARRFIESQRRKKIISSSVDTRTAATALTGMIDRFAYVWFVLEEDFDMEVAIDTLTELWIRSLGGDYTPA